MYHVAIFMIEWNAEANDATAFNQNLILGYEDFPIIIFYICAVSTIIDQIVGVILIAKSW